MIKRGTNPALLITLSVEMDFVDKVIFTFRQRATEDSTPMLQKIYPDDVSYSDGVFIIPFSQEETQLFSKVFFAEGQVNYINEQVEKTEIVALEMSPTLFTEVIDND